MRLRKDKQLNAQTLSSIETLHDRFIEIHDGKTQSWYPDQRFKPRNRKHFDSGQRGPQTDAASATEVMELIAASVLMVQNSPVVILCELLRRKSHASSRYAFNRFVSFFRFCSFLPHFLRISFLTTLVTYSVLIPGHMTHLTSSTPDIHSPLLYYL
jgi:hypothetical protein